MILYITGFESILNMCSENYAYATNLTCSLPIQECSWPLFQVKTYKIKIIIIHIPVDTSGLTQQLRDVSRAAVSTEHDLKNKKERMNIIKIRNVKEKTDWKSHIYIFDYVS